MKKTPNFAPESPLPKDMKNKHLVLLFLAVLVTGLLSRYLPIRYKPFFQNELIRVDTAAMTKCILLAPGQAELALERSETGWTADQHGRIAPIQADDMTPLLATLAGLSSVRRVKTDYPDSLGFADGKRLRVRIFRDTRLIEHFELGDEITENGQALTYIQLPMHNGVYLTPGHLRGMFARTLDDFRSKTVAPVSPQVIRRIGILDLAADTMIIFEKNDSLRHWASANRQFSLRDDSVQQWLALFNRLNSSPFADHFDESRARESRIAAIWLDTPDSAGLTLEFYYLKPPDVPEDLSGMRRQHLHALPAYVIQTSANPMNYFAAADTNLVRFLCFGLWQSPLSDKKIKE